MSTSALYPPSPKNKINPRDLSYYEGRGYLAQRKFNGSRNLIYISPDKDVKCFGRHGSSHSRFQMSNNLKEEILSSLDLIDGQEYWLDSELMNKTKSDYYRDKIILFDVLQAGQYFFSNPTQAVRLELLYDICNRPKVLDDNKGLAFKVSENILLAETFDSLFEKRFREKVCDEIEGLVLRDPNSIIGNFGAKKYEASWLIRCRRPNNMYNF
jgi:ATP-dependent DNA ligase